MTSPLNGHAAQENPLGVSQRAKKAGGRSFVEQITIPKRPEEKGLFALY
jgi:hypothetical protein